MASENGGEAEFKTTFQEIVDVFDQCQRARERTFDELRRLIDRHYAEAVTMADEGKRRVALIRQKWNDRLSRARLRNET